MSYSFWSGYLSNLAFVGIFLILFFCMPSRLCRQNGKKFTPKELTPPFALDTFELELDNEIFRMAPGGAPLFTRVSTGCSHPKDDVIDILVTGGQKVAEYCPRCETTCYWGPWMKDGWNAQS